MTVIRVKGNERARSTTSRSSRPALFQAHNETGLLIKLRVCEFYEKPTAGHERNKAAAVKRHFKRLRGQMLPKKFY